MAVSDIEAVVEFLRKNGLCESESALAEDVLEKPELRSFDFEKFLFPMVPPPPPLKISPSRGRLGAEAWDSGVEESDRSSEEFVSLDSSTSDVCSSEFTNPYGIHTTLGINSQASSDRLSQFGTARDYPDFDLQNDLCWYNEKDEDYTSPPYLSRADSFICPSEDKFIMTLETQNQIHDGHGLSLLSEGCQAVEKSIYLDKPWDSSFRSLDHVNRAEVADFHHLDKKVQYEGSLEKEKEGCTAYSSSIPPYACWAEAGGLFGQDTKDQSLMKLKVAEVNDLKCARSSTYDWAEVFESADDLHMAVEKDLLPNGNDRHEGGNGKEVAGDPNRLDNAKDFIPNGNDHYEGGNNKEVAGDPNRLDNVANEEEDATADQLLMYHTNEDEYEVFNLRIIHRKNRTGFEENRDFPIILNSIIAGRYYVTEYLGSAAFSKVVQANDLHTGIDVCLKIIKNNKDFFDQSLDEVKLLKFVNKHDPGDERHILRLYDYFYYQEHLFIVCELLRANLYEYQKYNRESGGEPYFTLSRLQLISRQCLEALEYLHELGIIHCDLKPENILLKSYRRCEIKVIDLGSSCFQADNLCLYVQSRSYRAPEVILGHPYDQKIDLWSLGCILAELCSGEVLFTNDAIVMLLSCMIGMLGPIDEEMLARGQETHKYFTEDYDLYIINEETNQLEYIIPKKSSLEHHLQVSDNGFIDFVRYLLEINPQRRPTAREALEHPWLSHQYELNS